jgi:hypothetical protein
VVNASARVLFMPELALGIVSSLSASVRLLCRHPEVFARCDASWKYQAGSTLSLTPGNMAMSSLDSTLLPSWEMALDNSGLGHVYVFFRP